MLDQDILDEFGFDNISDIPQEELQRVLNEYTEKSQADPDTKSRNKKVREQDNYIDETENFWVIRSTDNIKFKCRNCGRSTPVSDFLSHNKPNTHFGTCELDDSHV